MIKPIYDVDGITLYCDDCREILPQIGKVDLLLTDPPYGILNLESGTSRAVRKSARSSGSGKLKDRMLNTSDFSWDASGPTKDELIAIRGKADKQIIWGGNYFELPPCRGILCWDKCQPWPNFSQVEIAWTNLERPAALFKYDKSFVDNKTHPTQKPTALMRWCIGIAGECETILDPFAGSGTTLLAAKLEGRRAIGIEISHKYCESAMNRLKQGVLFGADHAQL